MADINARTRLLTGTPADWAANDLVLGLGELVIESAGTLVKFKAGDGSTRYSGLPFVTAVPDIPPEYVTQDEGDARYLQLAGISMTSTPNVVPRMGANGMLDAAMIPLPPAIAVTTGVADAGKLVKTAPSGKLDLTFLPPIISASGGATDADKLVKTNISGKVDLTFLPPIIAVSAGAADAGKLVKTAASGKIDPSLITITTGKYKGTADGTAARPAGTYIAGDYFINSGSGLADASWGLPIDTVVVPNQQLHFNGTTWDVVGSGDTNTMLLPDGTAAMPGLGFLADGTTGLFRPTPNGLGIAIGGIEKVRVSGDPDAQLLVGLSASLLTGNVGRGLVEIAGPTSATVNLDVAGVSTGLLTANAFGTIVGTRIAKVLALWTNNAEKVRLTETTDAQLLVGGTSATLSAAGRGLVEINGSSDAALSLNGAGARKGFVWASAGGLYVSADVGDLVLAAGGGARARVVASADAQLLVGTSTTSIGAAGRGLIELNGPSTALFALSKASVPKLMIFTDGSTSQLLTQSVPLIFYQASTEVARIDTDFTLKYQGIEVGWRNLPVVAPPGGSTTLDSTMRGKLIFIGNASTNFIVPGDDVFKAGEVITFVNVQGGPATFTERMTGSRAYLRWNGLTTGTRTLAVNGTATIMCIGGNTFMMTGALIS